MHKSLKILEEEGIPAPNGGTVWPKRAIDTILSKNKYAGDTIVRSRELSTIEVDRGLEMTNPDGSRYELYISSGNNPPIVSPEVFDKVQKMKAERSNIVFNPDGTRSRKGTHYSSKRATDENQED